MAAVLDDAMASAESATQEAAISVLSLVMMPLSEYHEHRTVFLAQAANLSSALNRLLVTVRQNFNESIPETLAKRIRYMQGVLDALDEAVSKM